MESDDFPDYSGALKADLLDQSPYRVEASFDGLSSIELSVNGQRAVKLHWSGRSDLGCGPVDIRIHGFDLETSALARLGPRTDVRAWLRDWSGISVYRDGFRVWPYGEPHDDWLRLDQRRVNNPVVRLSNNQIVGFVRISQDGNPDLRDQTNREGLINNRGLEDLRRLMYFVLEQLEAERQNVRHPRDREGATKFGKVNDGNDRSHALGRLEALLEKAPPGMRKELKGAIADVRKEMKAASAANVQREEGLLELAVAGQSMSSFLEPVSLLAEELQQHVERVPSGSITRADASHLRRDLRTGLTGLKQRLEDLRPIVGSSGRKRRTIAVDVEIENYASMIRPTLESKGITLHTRPSGEESLRMEMRPETLTRVLQVFAVNAMDWLEGTERARLTIEVRATDEWCRILVSDNGPGLPSGVGQRILEPLVSFKEGGQGMGLALARSVIERHGGTLEAVEDRRRRGATFAIELPRKRTRTVARSS